MSKWILLAALSGMALVGGTVNASAASVSAGFAQGFCRGQWVRNMQSHTSICSYCQVSPATGRPTGRPRCDFFVCDDGGSCEWVVIERRTPTGRWKNVRPSVAGTAVTR